MSLPQSPQEYNGAAQEETTMSATGTKLKSKKEYMVSELASVDELRARLKDQPPYGWELDQAFSHGGKLIAIFSKDAPSA